MLYEKHLRNNVPAGTGFIFPRQGNTAIWYLGAGLIYAGLGAPGGKKVVRELASIIGQPQTFAKMASLGLGGVLVLYASSS